ncbi:MAG: Fe-S cluster assembly protein SufD [Acidimicrobiia bacterium]|nr:MAG: Fe-S cluster assembly protein SufD [Acidimicrobiia bacterium]
MPDSSLFGTSDTAWMAEKRAAAIQLLPSLSMPTEREENWRYLDLDFDPALDAAAVKPGTGTPDPIVEGWHGTVVSIVDGFAVTEGVPTLAQLQDAEDLIKDRDLFSTAFVAYAPGSAYVGKDLIDHPVLVDIQSTGSATTFPGVHVDVPAGKDATVVVRMRSTNDEASIVIPTVAASVGDNARLTLSLIQDWNYQTRAIGRCVIQLGRDAGLTFSEIGLGGKVGRLHLDVDFVGNGSHGKIYGAYFGEDSQTLDYRYFMNHIGTNTRADMFLKGAVADRALSVFTGMIRIEETGQRTESFQTNRNLILSDGASAQSVPTLEILNNDVKCGHGSSIGPLDGDQRYYLMSRGLTPERADRLQVHGFFEEVVEQIPDDHVASWARDRINSKYIQAQEEGRV